MKTEELLEIGLTEEQATKVLAINGKDIERYKKAAYMQTEPILIRLQCCHIS